MKASLRQLRRRRGFTLLEVIVALAIFISGISVLTIAYISTLGAINRVQINQSLEQDLAMIRRHALVLSDLEKVEEGGEVATGRHGLAQWEVEIEPAEVADLFRVTLFMTLDPEDEEGVRAAQQQFYLTRPSWSDPIDRSELRARSKERFVEQQSQMQ